MIDNVAIYVSCIAVVYIIWRAALLDNLRPWFRPFRGDAEQADKPSATGRPQSELPVWRR